MEKCGRTASHFRRKFPALKAAPELRAYLSERARDARMFASLGWSLRLSSGRAAGPLSPRILLLRDEKTFHCDSAVAGRRCLRAAGSGAEATRTGNHAE